MILTFKSNRTISIPYVTNLFANLKLLGCENKNQEVKTIFLLTLQTKAKEKKPRKVKNI